MERRELPRLALNNVSVRFKKLSAATFWARLSPPFSIKDLSKSGLSFFSDFPVKKGEKIYLKLTFSDGSVISLKGFVRWFKKTDQSESRHLIGVQFLPFGKHSDYNDLSSLEYLRKLLPSARSDGTLPNEFEQHLQ